MELQMMGELLGEVGGIRKSHSVGRQLQAAWHAILLLGERGETSDRPVAFESSGDGGASLE